MYVFMSNSCTSMSYMQISWHAAAHPQCAMSVLPDEAVAVYLAEKQELRPMPIPPEPQAPAVCVCVCVDLSIYLSIYIYIYI